jgi:hypothetical protein
MQQHAATMVTYSSTEGRQPTQGEGVFIFFRPVGVMGVQENEESTQRRRGGAVPRITTPEESGVVVR